MNTLMWWGYLHSSGTIQVKRWFGDHKDYTEDCYDNEFVQRVIPPFAAETHHEAAKIILERLKS
jgi:hypothetical protein